MGLVGLRVSFALSSSIKCVGLFVPTMTHIQCTYPSHIAMQTKTYIVYTCQQCNTPATFPRYNSPRSIFSSRRGRCGEYANLFGTYCRALGYDTRYCLDLTDHVWVEVWSVRMGKWVHADSCEGVVDRPNMYEQVRVLFIFVFVSFLLVK